MRNSILNFIVLISLNSMIFSSDSTKDLHEITRAQTYNQKRIEEFKQDLIQCKYASNLLKNSSDLTRPEKLELKKLITTKRQIAKKGIQANRREFAILKTISFALHK